MFRGLERVSDVRTIDYRAVCRNKYNADFAVYPDIIIIVRIRMRASNEAFGTTQSF